MKNVLEKFRESSNELKNVHVLTLCGIFLALRVALGVFEINISEVYRVSFAHLPVALGGMLFGPVAGGIIGLFGDIITMIIKPTGIINFGILFARLMAGVIFGLILYKKPISILRTGIATTAVVLITDLTITTISLIVVYYSNADLTAILGVVGGRIFNYGTLLPIYIGLIYVMQVMLIRVKIPVLKDRNLRLATKNQK